MQRLLNDHLFDQHLVLYQDKVYCQFPYLTFQQGALLQYKIGKKEKIYNKISNQLLENYQKEKIKN